jgi:hypothetical protein
VINWSGVELHVFFVAFDVRITNIMGAAFQNAWFLKKMRFSKKLKKLSLKRRNS